MLLTSEDDLPKNLANFQLERLIEAFHFVKQSSPFYQRKLANKDIIQSYADFEALPLTEKDELSLFTDDFLTCSSSEISEIVTTSGSTGTPLMTHMTREDITRLGQNERLSFKSAGLTENDVVLLAVTLDKSFIAGLAYSLGLKELGATAVRVGPTNPEMLLSLAEKTSATTIVGVPSYLLRVAEVAERNSIDIATLKLSKFILIGEPIRTKEFKLNPLGKKLSLKWPGINFFSTYGMTELQTSLSECEYGMGGHLNPELLYLEIVNEEGQVIREGEGELVATTLGVRGMPVFRYKTGDVAFIQRDACDCGLKTPRISPILGRKGQKLKIKGTTIYPQAILNCLDGMDKVKDYVIEISQFVDGVDHVNIKCLVSDNFDNADITSIKNEMQGQLKITPQVSLSSMDELMKLKGSVSDRKKTKVIDLRKHT